MSVATDGWSDDDVFYSAPSSPVRSVYSTPPIVFISDEESSLSNVAFTSLEDLQNTPVAENEDTPSSITFGTSFKDPSNTPVAVTRARSTIITCGTSLEDPLTTPVAATKDNSTIITPSTSFEDASATPFAVKEGKATSISSCTSLGNAPAPANPAVLMEFCYCGYPARYGSCTACHDTPVPGHQNRYYCSVECWNVDWPRHLKLCSVSNTRRTLYRSGECLQEIFYMYRSKLFDRNVVEIKKTQSNGCVTLMVHQGLSQTKRTKDLHYLHKLSFELFGEEYQDDEDSLNEDKRAILSHAASAQSIVWLHDLIAYFLKDVVVDIKEQQVMPVIGSRSTILVDSYNNFNMSNLEHFVLVITLKNAAGTYVLDFCGAQYGFYETVTPIDEYQARGTACAEPTDFYGAESLRHSTDLLKNEKYRRGCLTRVNLETSKRLFKGAKNWENEYNVPIFRMLQASPGVFQRRKEDLLHYLAYEVQKRLNQLAKTSVDWEPVMSPETGSSKSSRAKSV